MEENLDQVLLYIFYLIFTKNGMEMFVHCFIEKVHFLNSSAQK